MTRTKSATLAVLGLCIGLMLCSSLLEASELPTVEQLFDELRLSDRDRHSVREGEIVTWLSDEGSERELALGLAMLVHAKSDIVVPLFREATALKKVPSVIAYGKIVGEGTLADFDKVKLAPNGDKEARRYLEAKPGSDLNLDEKEIAAFRALKSASKDGTVPIQKVEGVIRERLARYRPIMLRDWQALPRMPGREDIRRR